jgi:REP element-mobilizing transposase RayT
LPGIHRSAQKLMSGPPVFLNLKQAEVLLQQFQETASFRDWTLHAVAIMTNHFHLVVEVKSDPDPRKVLGDFKAYGTRALNESFGKPLSETWWTARGSKRKLPDDQATASAINYVLFKQPNPLVVWSRGRGRLV